MDSVKFQNGLGASYYTLQLMQSILSGALNSVFKAFNSNLTGYKVWGCVVTKTPSGNNIIYGITEGWLYIDGELTYFAGGSIESFNSDLVWFEIEAAMIGNSVLVYNTGTAQYHEQRVAVLKDGNTIPSKGVSVDAVTIHNKVLELSGAASKTSFKRASYGTTVTAIGDSSVELLSVVFDNVNSYDKASLRCQIEWNSDYSGGTDKVMTFTIYVDGVAVSELDRKQYVENGERYEFQFEKLIDIPAGKVVKVDVSKGIGLSQNLKKFIAIIDGYNS
jgi:hypothetical protein